MKAYNLAIWALTVWREARGESYNAKLAIAHVIRNRMNDAAKRWPRTPSGVCLQRLQFSCFNTNDPNVALYPKDDDPVFLECCQAVEEADANGFDASRGANHYHHLPSGQEPKWADKTKLTVAIGKGKFYKL